MKPKKHALPISVAGLTPLELARKIPVADQDVAVDTVPLNDWQTARDIVCRIGEPNSSFSPLHCYSTAHFERIGGISKISTVMI